MSDDPVVSAPGFPGEVIETSTQLRAAPVVGLSDTTGFSESKAAAMNWVDTVAKPALLHGGESNFLLLKNYNAALEHIYHGGPEPEWLKTERGEPSQPDMRPADGGLTQMFEDIARPADESQMTAAVRHAVLQGVDRGLAEGVSALCAELQLSEGHTAAVLDRARAHFGKDHWHEAADDIEVLDAAGIAEYTREASRILGSAEKLQAMRERAYAYVKSLGLESKYADLWRSSLGFDPKFLHTLAMAGARRGGK